VNPHQVNKGQESESRAELRLYASLPDVLKKRAQENQPTTTRSTGFLKFILFINLVISLRGYPRARKTTVESAALIDFHSMRMA